MRAEFKGQGKLRTPEISPDSGSFAPSLRNLRANFPVYLEQVIIYE